MLPTTHHDKSRQDDHSLLWVLAAVSCLKAVATFWLYDISKSVQVLHIIFWLNLGCTVLYLPLQRPFTSGKRLSSRLLWRVAGHSLTQLFVSGCCLAGLTVCGPLRTLLIFGQSDIVVMAALSSFFSAATTPARARASMGLLVAFLIITLFDYDSLAGQVADHPEGEGSHGFATHNLYYFVSLLGISDHKAGAALLVAALALKTLISNADRKLAIDVGGGKRLHALTTVGQAVIVLPWSLLTFLTDSQRSGVAVGDLVLPFFFVILSQVVYYYVESLCTTKHSSYLVARVSNLSLFSAALLLTAFWNHPMALQLRQTASTVLDEHSLSLGLFLASLLILYATLVLTSSHRASQFDLIGTGRDGQPLYREAHHSSVALAPLLRNMLTKIIAAPDSRKIFYFLCLNLSFTFVELFYGFWTNSLGLISDGFHMFFDCTALVIGLIAAVMSSWQPTRHFSFGYDRVEILSGFVNGLFLIVVSLAVFMNALDRLLDPPHVNTHRLMVVSFGGLIVNLFGIAAFSMGGGDKAEEHGHSHGAAAAHGHSHSHGHSHNMNLQGVFLHVLADTLGSVGVIVSSFLIQQYGLNVADPLCSIFIAALIFMSVLPLLRETSYVLLLRTPTDLQKEVADGLKTVLTIEGVKSYTEQHFWRHSGNVVMGSLHLQLQPAAVEQRVIAKVVSTFKELGFGQVAIQAEKDEFYHHANGLGISPQKIFGFSSKTAQADNYDTAFTISVS